MNHRKRSQFKVPFSNFQRRVVSQRGFRDRASAGLTLIELLIATLITTIVILVVWNGFISALNGSQIAEAKTARRVELNRAFDFMTTEIRKAQSINKHGSTVANGTTTIADVVSSSGLNLSNLGNYGTLALYLEIPVDKNVPATCPAGGPNAGSTPPTYDRVVYDIRSSIQQWLGPRSINRYGRIPNIDGSIDPCSSPVSNDILIDAISQTMNVAPTCASPGVLSGAEGFYTCVKGAQVDLFFQSKIIGSKTGKLVSAATSRLVNINSQAELMLAWTPRPPNVNDVNLAWQWSDGSSATSYTLHRIWRGTENTPYTGTGLSFPHTIDYANSGEDICFWTEATVGTSNTVRSNTVCITKS
jgi:type II secretory pathway pseudopilin PulG